MSVFSEANAISDLRDPRRTSRGLLGTADRDFHPEQLVRDISESFSVDERVDFQARVRAVMIEQPDVPIVEHMLEAAVAIEASEAD